MNSLTLKYRPVKILAWYRTLEVSFPSGWHEVAPDQMQEILRATKDKTSDDRLLQVLTRVPARIIRRLDRYQKFCIFRLLFFISGNKISHKYIIPDISGRLFPPGEKLKGMQFGQYVFADTYYDRYAETRDREDLYKFVACVYLPRKRQFEERTIGRRVKIIRKESDNVLEAVVYNHMMIRQWLAEAYTFVFNKEGSKKKTSRQTTWLDVLDKVVGDDLVHEDAYARLPLHTVMRYLNNKIREHYKNG